MREACRRLCPPTQLAWVHPLPPQEHGMGAGGLREGRQPKGCWQQLGMSPRHHGLRLLPDLESSCWESHPGSCSRGWQHAIGGDHRGGGHSTPHPSTAGPSSRHPPFPRKSPCLGAVPRDRGGHPAPPQHGSCTPGGDTEGCQASGTGRGTAGSQGHTGARTEWRGGLTAGTGQEISGFGGCYCGGAGGRHPKAAGRRRQRCSSRRAPL